MVKISKELFVATIEAIKAGYEEQLEFDKAMSKFSDNYFISTIGNVWADALLTLLEDVMGDKLNRKYGSILSWWLYENTEKVLYLSQDHPKNSTGSELAIKVDTAEQLYDYFVLYH